MARPFAPRPAAAAGRGRRFGEPSPEQDSGRAGCRYGAGKRIGDARSAGLLQGRHITANSALRLYYQPQNYELARFISYGGKREKQVKEKCDELRERFGDQKVMWALHELTTKDDATGLTVLRPHVRKMCWQLLGPAPEHEEYESYWAHKKKDPPADHQPPGPEEGPGPSPKRRGGRSR